MKIAATHTALVVIDMQAVLFDPQPAEAEEVVARINGLAERLTIVKSSGYGAHAIRRGAPYDLIMANILARPLYRMALAQVAAVIDGRCHPARLEPDVAHRSSARLCPRGAPRRR